MVPVNLYQLCFQLAAISIFACNHNNCYCRQGGRQGFVQQQDSQQPDFEPDDGNSGHGPAAIVINDYVHCRHHGRI